MRSVHYCDGCGRAWMGSELESVSHMEQRVDAGGVVPSGECRECGALCYPEGSFRVDQDVVRSMQKILKTKEVLPTLLGIDPWLDKQIGRASR